MLEQLALADFVNGTDGQPGNRFWLGPLLLLAVILVILDGVSLTGQAVLQYRRRSAWYRHIKHSLTQLTDDEKAFLRTFFDNQVSVVKVAPDHGAANSLCSKGICYCPSPWGSWLDGLAFSIDPWAREFLEKHQHLLHYGSAEE